MKIRNAPTRYIRTRILEGIIRKRVKQDRIKELKKITQINIYPKKTEKVKRYKRENTMRSNHLFEKINKRKKGK